MVAPLRPDKYLRMGAVVAKGVDATTGISLAARRRPHGTAIIDELGSLTWAQLEARCRALAVGLAGLDRGTAAPIGTIAILCRNHRGFVESLVASSLLGADTLLLNTSFAGPQLADVVEREAVDLLIYDDEFAGVVAAVDELPEPPQRIRAWTDAGIDSAEPRVDDLVHGYLGETPVRADRQGRIVLLTSGTTGTPKGARRPGGGDVGTLVAMLDRIPWRAERTVVIAAPMFHAWGFGQLLIAASMTCTVVTRRRFDPEATLKMVADHRATGLAVVPVMIERILDLPPEIRRRHDTSSLTFVTASGSRMRPDAVVLFMDEFGDIVYNSYNATEAGMIATATPADLRFAPDTAGRPCAGTDVKILDAEGDEVAPGDVGTIYVRNNSQFDGYTSGDSKSFHRGYMSSGDVGRLDEAGRLYVVGRDDEMIVSGGENVYPLEVEQTLGAHAEVREAAVIGVDDHQYGQRLSAFVVLNPGASVSPDDLKAHVKAHLAAYKVPREVTLLDELPRNSTGKIMKRDLHPPA
ncbi:MAG: AMP-binding protein [Actinomycetota bacterium]|nr:AMP-binding protein [Actinomycetota bacterium]